MTPSAIQNHNQSGFPNIKCFPKPRPQGKTIEKRKMLAISIQDSRCREYKKQIER